MKIYNISKQKIVLRDGMMEDKSIIIIGAGLAGMSTGCYAQMNGYKTKIFVPFICRLEL